MVEEGERSWMKRRRKRSVNRVKIVEERRRERESMRKSRVHKGTYSKDRLTTICQKYNNLLGGTFAGKSALRGTQSLCATLLTSLM